MRRTLMLAVAVLAIACSPTRTVKIGWDVPAVAPDGYRIFIDDQMMLDVPPPPMNRRCNCLMVSLNVARDRHIVRVLAYNRSGTAPAASIAVE
jgi:hypothetical protein